MRICYALLSPTFGMHQYTADLANRMSAAGHEVSLVTTTHCPRDRYTPGVNVCTPVATTNTGFSAQGFRLKSLGHAERAIYDLQPDVVHFTGPHLWNLPLVQSLTAHGLPVVHTLHDLDPHTGARWPMLMRAWNWLIIRSASQILVHAQSYRKRLLDSGVPYTKVTHTPLLHLFLSAESLAALPEPAASVAYEPWALFFGRIEPYKGINHLFAAWEIINGSSNGQARLVVAGPGDLSHMWTGALPERVEFRNRLINDDEAIDLFRRCGLLVLPYTAASQSALIAAAYYFRKPVVVTRSGSLPEYVVEGHTGCVVEPAHPATLARSLENMLSEPSRLMTMGAAGRAWYDSRLVSETQTLLNMYRQLAYHPSAASSQTLSASS